MIPLDRGAASAEHRRRSGRQDSALGGPAVWKLVSITAVAIVCASLVSCFGERSSRQGTQIPQSSPTARTEEPSAAPQQAAVPKKPSTRETTMPEPAARPDSLPPPEGKVSAIPTPPRPEKKPTAELPARPSKPRVTVEPIAGFAAPAEYLRIDSEYFPGAVAAVALPIGYEEGAGKRYPLVIAFSGAGECARPRNEGALAWIEYYKTDEAIAALEDGALEKRDFRDLVTRSRLREFNDRLRRTPYQGVILVCPYSPPSRWGGGPELPEYEAFIMDELIPLLKERYPVDPRGTGVDGVSMGGARSMYYGFKYPDVFYSIGSVQGAFGPYMDIYADLIDVHRDKLRTRAIQLVTSTKDVMAPSVEKLHRLLGKKGIPHTYSVLSGPHDYIFNQGPGALALLLFHNEAFRAGSGPVR